jgi:hypothetical protein
MATFYAVLAKNTRAKKKIRTPLQNRNKMVYYEIKGENFHDKTGICRVPAGN